MFHAELLRTRGDLFRRVGYDPTRAEGCYRSALDVSQSQEARAAELRAAVSLGRLLRDEGRKTEARELLEQIYEWFTEGFETVDLREAQHLIEELRG